MIKGKTVLYLSHVIWNWIKQRPQYVAEELTTDFDVLYLQPQVHRDHGLAKNDINNLTVEDIPRIPTLGGKLSFIAGVNDAIARQKVSSEITNRGAHLLWLTSPLPFNWIPADYSGKVIYDCMDDHGAFLSGADSLRMDTLERKLVNRADFILASSSRLVDKMHRLDVTGTKDVLLVRNGFDGKVIDLGDTEKTKPMVGGHFKACYFGTIGPWFDFSAVQESLCRIPNLTYKIIGPVDDGVELFQDERIEYTGPVAHDSLGEYVADCDFFVMPFQINDIVLSVDPVKIYEYINFGKDVVCVRYPEVERFVDYAELYNGIEGYCKALRKVINSSCRKYSDEQRVRILAESSWTSRIEPVLEKLGEF